jgi:hypothetical protein
MIIAATVERHHQVRWFDVAVDDTSACRLAACST